MRVSTMRCRVIFACLFVIVCASGETASGQACIVECSLHPDVAGLFCQSGLANESGTAGMQSTSGIPACAAAGTYNIQHASRFDVGAGNTTNITDICIGTFANAVTAVQIFSATASPTEPPAAAALWQVFSPSVTNVNNTVMVNVAPVNTPFQVTGDFWIVVTYDGVQPTTVTQAVATRSSGKAMLRVNQNCNVCTACGAPCVAAVPTCQTWVDYDNLNMFQYIGNAPRIRPLQFVQVSFCPGGGQYTQDCCDTICVLDPNCCVSWDPACFALAAANCATDCNITPPVGTYIEQELCPLPPPPPPNTNNACFVTEVVPCDSPGIFGTISAHSGIVDEDWYAIDLFNHDSTGVATFQFDVISDSPIEIEVYTGDAGFFCSTNQTLWFSGLIPSCTQTPLNGNALFPAGVNVERFFIVVRSAIVDNSCATDNNDYHIAFTVTNCATQPNETCATAIPLQCNAITLGSTGMAQLSNPPACGLASNTAGVWYSIVGNDEVIRLSTCGSSETMALALYIGNCGSLNCLDDSALDLIGTCVNPSAASLEFFGFSGILYYVYVAPRNLQGDFVLEVTCTPVNDTCAEAETVVCGVTTTGTTINATTSNAPTCAGIANTQGDAWYHFVGTGGIINVDICDPGTVANHYLSIYTDTCGTLTCVDATGTDQLGICGGTNFSSLGFMTTAGDDYYIAVHANGTPGPFVLNITCPTVANDDCANATVIGRGIVSWDNCLATTDGPPEPCGFTGAANDDHDIWYTFTIPFDGTWDVNLPASGIDQAVAVYTGCPFGGGVLIGCDGAPAGVPFTVSGIGLAGEQFWIRLGGLGGQCSSGDLELVLTRNCRWDIATPGGPGQDGQVNVFDLLMLLNNWGGSGPGDDLESPFTIVDVFDLLSLLANWNPCP